MNNSQSAIKFIMTAIDDANQLKGSHPWRHACRIDIAFRNHDGDAVTQLHA